jgi:hypothetical protein
MSEEVLQKGNSDAKMSAYPGPIVPARLADAVLVVSGSHPTRALLVHQ